MSHSARPQSARMAVTIMALPSNTEPKFGTKCAFIMSTAVFMLLTKRSNTQTPSPRLGNYPRMIPPHQLSSPQGQLSSLQLGLLLGRIHVQVNQAASRPGLGRALSVGSLVSNRFLSRQILEEEKERGNSPNQDTPPRSSASTPSSRPRGSAGSCLCTRSGGG